MRFNVFRKLFCFIQLGSRKTRKDCFFFNLFTPPLIFLQIKGISDNYSRLQILFLGPRGSNKHL